MRCGPFMKDRDHLIKQGSQPWQMRTYENVSGITEECYSGISKA